MIQAKVPQLVAMQISEHKTPSMFHRYGITVEDEQREAMQATEAYHQKKTEQAGRKRNVVSISK